MSRLAERVTDLQLKDDLDAAIEDAIQTCGGDARVDVGALIMGQRSLQEACATHRGLQFHKAALPSSMNL